MGKLYELWCALTCKCPKCGEHLACDDNQFGYGNWYCPNCDGNCEEIGLELEFKATERRINMKANELMVGDWVRVEAHRGFNAQNVNVETIPDNDGDNEYGHHYGHIGAWLEGGDNDFRDVEARHLQPIPLTAEILEKNGFERSEVFVEWKYENDDVYMVYKPFPYLKIQTEECIVAFPCQYVHELQHALRLCEIEKEIIL